MNAEGTYQSMYHFGHLMLSARSDWSKYLATKQMSIFNGARRESEALSCNRMKH